MPKHWSRGLQCFGMAWPWGFPLRKPHRHFQTVRLGVFQRNLDAQSSQKYSGRAACLMAALATHPHGCGWVARMWETLGFPTSVSCACELGNLELARAQP